MNADLIYLKSGMKTVNNFYPLYPCQSKKKEIDEQVKSKKRTVRKMFPLCERIHSSGITKHAA